MKTNKYVSFLSLMQQKQTIEQAKARLRLLRRRLNQALKLPRETLTPEERGRVDAAVVREGVLSAELKKLKADYAADCKIYDEQEAAADKWQDEEDARIAAKAKGGARG